MFDTILLKRTNKSKSEIRALSGAENIILNAGEPLYCITDNCLYVGNGTDPLSLLDPISGSSDGINIEGEVKDGKLQLTLSTDNGNRNIEIDLSTYVTSRLNGFVTKETLTAEKYVKGAYNNSNNSISIQVVESPPTDPMENVLYFVLGSGSSSV